MTASPASLFRSRFSSPVGPLTVVASDAGVRALLWPDDEADRVPLRAPVVDARRAADHIHLAAATAALQHYFAGEPIVPPTLDPAGTPFQLAVWRQLADVPCGQTWTYRQLAGAVGRPTAARAVGAAVGRNPISVLIPCHRIVGSDGTLTGFAGGLATKRWLLDHEGCGHMAGNARGRDRDVRSARFEA